MKNLTVPGFRSRRRSGPNSSDSDIYYLRIASPVVDSEGGKAAYTRIDGVIRGSLGHSGITLREVSAVSPRDAAIKGLKRAVRTGPRISNMRLTRSVIGNVYFEDAYVYRVQ